MTLAADAAVCQCGDPKAEHDGGSGICRSPLRCDCAIYLPVVADVNRPEPMTLEQAMALCTHRRFMVATKGRKSTWICQTCKVESDIPFPAVPDREGATEQLAAILAAHGWRDNYDDGEHVGYICACRAPESGPMDTDIAAHIAEQIIANGWRKA